MKKVSAFEYAIMQVADPEGAKECQPETEAERMERRKTELMDQAKRMRIAKPSIAPTGIIMQHTDFIPTPCENCGHPDIPDDNVGRVCAYQVDHESPNSDYKGAITCNCCDLCREKCHLGKFEEFLEEERSDSATIKTEKLKKKRGGDNGKRKPIVDEYGKSWCNCTQPRLTSPIGRGSAYCLKCNTPYYR